MFEFAASFWIVTLAIATSASGACVAIAVLRAADRGATGPAVAVWGGAGLGGAVCATHWLTGAAATGHASQDPIWLTLVFAWTAMSTATVFARLQAARSDERLVGCGLLLGAVVSISHVAIDIGPASDLPGIDVLPIAVSAAVTLAASASAVVMSRMQVGFVRLVGASGLLTLAIIIGSLHDPAADVWIWELADEALGRLGGPSFVFAFASIGLAAVGTVYMMHEVSPAGATGANSVEAVAVSAGMRGDVRDSLETLRACLELMSADTLSLVQRSRLDTARACAADLAGLLTESGERGHGGDHVAAPAEKSCSTDVCPATPRRVLLVDDVALNRTVLGAMLKRLGVSVDVAADGHAALAAMRQGSFDLVLMDTDMPGMSGLDATEAARADPVLRHQAIVGLSADVLYERDDGADAGMDDVVPKQMTLERLAELIERWTGEAAPRAGWDDPGDREISYA